VRTKRAENYGFCAGVRIADRKVKKFAQLGNRGGHILGQVVHNERVVDEMERLGVRTVRGMGEVAEGTIVFSAHGVPPSAHEEARRRGLAILDTTCPFVYDISTRPPRRSPPGRTWSSSATRSIARWWATPATSTRRATTSCSRSRRRAGSTGGATRG
jgi:4-hydroxy-3-methylbut-2-enyl diphosphate reductase